MFFWRPIAEQVFEKKHRADEWKVFIRHATTLSNEERFLELNMCLCRICLRDCCLSSPLQIMQWHRKGFEMHPSFQNRPGEDMRTRCSGFCRHVNTHFLLRTFPNRSLTFGFGNLEQDNYSCILGDRFLEINSSIFVYEENKDGAIRGHFICRRDTTPSREQETLTIAT